MPVGLRTRIKTLFARKEPRLDKGKARADPPTSPLLPILDISELHLAPATLARSSAFYLVGHSLPPAPLDQAKQLLTSPATVKDTLRHPRGSTVRGYNSATGSGREWWDYSPEQGGTTLTLPDEEFQRATKAYFDAGIALLRRICEQFNTDTPIIPDEVLLDKGFSTMRYLRYSPAVFPKHTTSSTDTTTSTSNMNMTDPSTIPRMEAHTDHGILTLMTATEPSGLYTWDRHGQIFSAPPLDNAVLIIAGDLMAHFTSLPGTNILDGDSAVGEDTVLPTVHAVVIPRDAGERYSVAVFLRPRRDMVVNRGGKDEDMTFAKWADEKGKIKGRRCWMVGQKTTLLE
ncbi:hypothetical protein ABW21_db0209383 [Orbilia brochopaga]|nr:hypothetical protein ABW21_db0209383 [Drechslerella brochopaga]